MLAPPAILLAELAAAADGAAPGVGELTLLGIGRFNAGAAADDGCLDNDGSDPVAVEALAGRAVSTPRWPAFASLVAEGDGAGAPPPPAVGGIDAEGGTGPLGEGAPAGGSFGIVVSRCNGRRGARIAVAVVFLVPRGPK